MKVNFLKVKYAHIWWCQKLTVETGFHRQPDLFCLSEHEETIVTL